MLSPRVPMTYRAPLPSLPPLETEVVPLTPLIVKCLNTTSPKEKNDLIMKIIALWKEQKQQLLKIKRENLEKNAILQQIIRRKETRSEDLEKLNEETQFYREPEELKSRKPVDYFIDSIKEAEELRKKYQPVSKPYLLDKIMDSHISQDNKLFKLYDLLFQRWEETAYSYHNRLNKLQESIETEFDIKDEFGGSSGLYNRYLELTEENKKLLDEEALIVNDAFIKRRKSKSMTHFTTRALISLFQEIIQKNTAALKTFAKYDFDARVEDAEMSFDSLLKDQQFISKNQTFDETGNENTPKEEQLQQILNLIEEEKSLHRDLQSQIDEIYIPPLPIEGPQQYQKIAEENKRCNAAILELKHKIDEIGREESELVQQLRKVIAENYKVENTIPIQTSELNNLIHIHATLLPDFYRNTTDRNTLSTVSMSFCNTLLHDKDAAFEHLKNQIDFLAREKEAEIAAIEAQLHEVKEPKSEESSPSLMHNPRLHFKRKLRKTMSVTSSKAVLEEKIPQLEPVFFSRTELFCGLSTIAELGEVTHKREMLHNFTQTLLSELRDKMRSEIRQYEKWFSGSIGNTKMLSNAILVKEKAETGIQSTSDVNDMEIQTEEEEPPGKGKKNTKAKSPAKKKR